MPHAIGIDVGTTNVKVALVDSEKGSKQLSPKERAALLYELATSRFIDQREDVLFLGPPGTGKSHLAQAIGRAAIQQGHRVVYREAHTLIEEIADATLDGTRKEYFTDLALRSSRARRRAS